MTQKSPTEASTAQPSTVEGPVTGGRHGWAFNRPLIDLADKGYVEAEFFLSGEATTYALAPGAQMSRDGRWPARPRGKVPFKTRFLVYRPADPARFNGTAVVCWNNVTAGYELFFGEGPEVLEEGYAYVCATVQRVGVHGFAENPQGLAAWDPERYGSLSIPTDDASYDIFSQVARAVGPGRDRTVDPLGGLDVRKVIGLGASQSAGRLATYVNAIHPLAPDQGGHAFDGYMLQIYFGSGTPLEASDRPVNPNAAGAAVRLPRGQSLIREDLDVPAMIVNTELEAIACLSVRQPDTARFCTWEAAALTHVSYQAQLTRNEKYRRDFGVAPPAPSEQMNRIYLQPFYDAALHHLNRWVNGGAPPPGQPPIDFDAEGQVVRDRHGIATGGARLPQADAPVAMNSSTPVSDDFAGRLRGSNRPFDAATLDALYGDEAGYLTRFRAAAEAAVAAGVLMPRDVAPALAEAAQEYRRAHAMAQAPAAAE
ncbi:alpha/beta hydrolase domain-containing protein [Caulobacter sp. KR2-114]|uniref:alpha/beta hydrolase domain-containing protein n=1 Tax=Caulobacter sp. KR2-114 TaxID=3400912 RepID=UPI003BFF0B60